MKYSTKHCQPPAPGSVFLLGFTRAAPRQVDKGREQNERLRSSSPLVIEARAGRIEKQKNKLPRQLWTANGRFELTLILKRNSFNSIQFKTNLNGLFLNIQNCSIQTHQDVIKKTISRIAGAI